jgi:hypothetical protein
VEESADEVLTRLERYVGEESPEEILARLERYAASLPAWPPAAPLVRAAAPSVVDARAAAVPMPAVDTLIPSRRESARHERKFLSEVAPALLAVSICAFVILVFEWLDPVVALAIATALALVGTIGLVQRVWLARAFTFGLLVAVLLVRFS